MPVVDYSRYVRLFLSCQIRDMGLGQLSTFYDRSDHMTQVRLDPELIRILHPLLEKKVISTADFIF